MDDLSIIILKLFLAAFFGFLLGIERESKHKQLGVKTYVIVATASCLLTIISIESGIRPYQGRHLSGGDPMRLAGQIVSGIGFLGAGAIFRSNKTLSTA